MSLALLMLCPIATANEKDSFERLYEEARRSYGVDNRLSDKWLTWEGLSSRTGLDLVLDDLTMPGGGGRRLFSFFMLDHMRLPREQIASRIMERAAEVSGEPHRLGSHMVILDRYGDEPGVVPFWASYLSDTRSTEVKPRHPESLIGQTRRVCDVAQGCLKRWLEQKKLWMPGDPGYGDPGGEMMWEVRNQVIDALNEVLLKNKLITTAVRPDPKAVTSAPPPGPPKEDVSPHAQPSPPNPWQKRRTPEAVESRWWAWVLGAVIVGGGLVWVLLKRRA